MADNKPGQPQAPAPQREGVPANPVPAPQDQSQLGKAGESSDPEVQNLLARREIAIRNDDNDAVDALTRELEEHGVTD